MRGLTDINLKRYNEILNENVCNFLDWSFVNAGAYINNTYSPSNKLVKQISKNYTNGTLWQSPHSNFVWESGIERGQPVNISGVHVNNVFLPLNSGYYIDYINGNVIFDTAQTGVVELNYSSKWINVLDAKDIPFFKRLREPGYYTGTFNKSDFSAYNTNVSFPLICVETIRRGNAPYELGGCSRLAKSDVVFYIFGERKGDVDRIGDILVDQDDKAFYLYDANMVSASGDYPFNNLGVLNENPKTYKDLVKLNEDGGYRKYKCYIRQPYGEDIKVLSKDIYQKTVTWKTECVLPTA